MKVAIANDHAAVPGREKLVEHLKQSGVEVIDFGVDTTDSVDYPEQARKAVEAVRSGQADRAILACGTGIGMSISANKFQGIRCALCTDTYGAQMARQHNDANVLALRSRRMAPEQNCDIIDTFLNTDFEGDRHQRRLDLIAGFED